MNRSWNIWQRAESLSSNKWTGKRRFGLINVWCMAFFSMVWTFWIRKTNAIYNSYIESIYAFPNVYHRNQFVCLLIFFLWLFYYLFRQCLPCHSKTFCQSIRCFSSFYILYSFLKNISVNFKSNYTKLVCLTCFFVYFSPRKPTL